MSEAIHSQKTTKAMQDENAAECAILQGREINPQVVATIDNAFEWMQSALSPTTVSPQEQEIAADPLAALYRDFWAHIGEIMQLEYQAVADSRDPPASDGRCMISGITEIERGENGK